MKKALLPHVCCPWCTSPDTQPLRRFWRPMEGPKVRR
jgi:hypothetical protein